MNNITARLRFNGKPIDGMVAVFPIPDEEFSACSQDWVTIAVDVEAAPNVATTTSVRLTDLGRLLQFVSARPLLDLVQDWYAAAEDEVDAGAALAYRHCADQLRGVVE